MTPDELHRQLNNTYGLKQWPATLEVDAETYAQVCNTILQNAPERYFKSGAFVSIGPNGGVLFKNVELILNLKKFTHTDEVAKR